MTTKEHDLGWHNKLDALWRNVEPYRSRRSSSDISNPCLLRLEPTSVNPIEPVIQSAPNTFLSRPCFFCWPRQCSGIRPWTTQAVGLYTERGRSVTVGKHCQKRTTKPNKDKTWINKGRRSPSGERTWIPSGLSALWLSRLNEAAPNWVRFAENRDLLDRHIRCVILIHVGILSWASLQTLPSPQLGQIVFDSERNWSDVLRL